MKLTEKGNRLLAEIASRHNVSRSAVEHLFAAVLSGRGNQAQFNHAEFGGMGQWSAGGMTMISDMFNAKLKDKVTVICGELADLSRNDALQQPQPTSEQSQDPRDASNLFVPASQRGGNWWPEALGHAASTGAQNDLRYAFFPSSHRLAISLDGTVTVYDTADHQIGGFSQQQGGEQSITLTSQHGLVSVADLQQVHLSEQPRPADPQANPAPTAKTVRPQAADQPSAGFEDDILTKIERLAALHAKGILQDEEFFTKKRELLDRL